MCIYDKYYTKTAESIRSRSSLQDDTTISKYSRTNYLQDLILNPILLPVDFPKLVKKLSLSRASSLVVRIMIFMMRLAKKLLSENADMHSTSTVASPKPLRLSFCVPAVPCPLQFMTSPFSFSLRNPHACPSCSYTSLITVIRHYYQIFALSLFRAFDLPHPTNSIYHLLFVIYRANKIWNCSGQQHQLDRYSLLFILSSVISNALTCSMDTTSDLFPPSHHFPHSSQLLLAQVVNSQCCWLFQISQFIFSHITFDDETDYRVRFDSFQCSHSRWKPKFISKFFSFT